MFYLLSDMEKELEVHPRYFGPKLRDEIERRLRQEVGKAPPPAVAAAAAAAAAALLRRGQCCTLLLH